MWGIAFVLIVAVAIVLLFLLDRIDLTSRSEREYARNLLVRESINEQQLFARYFDKCEAAPDEPGRVRKIFADRMHYPSDKILPDDDLMFYWGDLDLIDLIRDFEREFGITISQKDVDRVSGCTIRAFTQLIAGKSGRSNSKATRFSLSNENFPTYK